MTSLVAGSSLGNAKYFHSSVGTNSWLAIDLGTAGQQVASVKWYVHPSNGQCNGMILDSMTSCGLTMADVDYSHAAGTSPSRTFF